MQVVVDAVAMLLSAGAFSPGRGTDKAAEGGDPNSSSSGKGGQTAWALDFLATHLGDGRATEEPDTVMQVQLRLCLQAWVPPARLASHASGQHTPAI